MLKYYFVIITTYVKCKWMQIIKKYYKQIMFCIKLTLTLTLTKTLEYYFFITTYVKCKL